MVHAFPYMPNFESFLDTLASNKGFPSSQQLAVTSHSESLTAEWKDVDGYAKCIYSSMFAMERSPYIPLSQHVAPRSLDNSTISAASRFIFEAQEKLKQQSAIQCSLLNAVSTCDH